MKTRMQSVTIVALMGLLAGPVLAQGQARTGVQMAAELEAAASTLHGQADRWGDVATLYAAAAELRPEGDPQAQTDLLLAANLYVYNGDVAAGIEALETAGSRALAGGDAEVARRHFFNAAVVAHEAGLSREYRRLSYRTMEAALATPGASRERLRDLVGAAPSH